MSNNYRKASLIYGVRDHSINQDLGSGKEARMGISEVQAETQQGNVYKKRGAQVGRVGEVQEMRLRLKVESRVGSGCLLSSGAEAKFRESWKCVMLTGDGCCSLEVAGYCQQMSRGCYGM